MKATQCPHFFVKVTQHIIILLVLRRKKITSQEARRHTCHNHTNKNDTRECTVVVPTPFPNEDDSRGGIHAASHDYSATHARGRTDRQRRCPQKKLAPQTQHTNLYKCMAHSHPMSREGTQQQQKHVFKHTKHTHTHTHTHTSVLFIAQRNMLQHSSWGVHCVCADLRHSQAWMTHIVAKPLLLLFLAKPHRRRSCAGHGGTHAWGHRERAHQKHAQHEPVVCVQNKSERQTEIGTVTQGGRGRERHTHRLSLLCCFALRATSCEQALNFFYVTVPSLIIILTLLHPDRSACATLCGTPSRTSVLVRWTSDASSVGGGVVVVHGNTFT